MPIREAGRVRARAKRPKVPHPVRAERERLKIKPSQFARLAEITPSTLWRIEEGLVKPHPKTLKKIEAALKRAGR